MTTQRILLAQFCDDVRQELGNKYSLMGCYGDEIIIDKLPAALPKLCAQLRAITPLDKPFKKLAFRAFLNDEQIAEIDLPQDQLELAAKAVCAREDSIRLSVMAIMAFSPLMIAEPSRLRVEAETEDGVLKGGCINLRERMPGDPTI